MLMQVGPNTNTLTDMNQYRASMTVPPPGLLSTMTGCFQSVARRVAARRPRVSLKPPGG
ncbi:MAG: hypothetical protein MO853_08730 [Candidatus Protistobacter heckmanni]|nr:hypothetical protein [Candidatus Protistobacter heckmanni]